MIRSWWQKITAWVIRYWKKLVFLGGGGLVLLFVVVQLAYPTDHLLPFASVEGVNVSAWTKNNAVQHLNGLYKAKTIPIYFGDSKQAYRTPNVSELGITAHNKKRIETASYPWYLRLVPSSLLWAHRIVKIADHPDYARNDNVLSAYIKKELGESCSVTPKDAGLKVDNDKLVVVPSAPGGTCEAKEVVKALQQVQPVLGAVKVTIAMKKIMPAVGDETALKLADAITKRIDSGVSLKVGEAQQLIPASTVLGWLDFTVKDKALVVDVNSERAKASYLDKNVAPKVAAAPGVTIVTTHDFTETARQPGPDGRALDNLATLENLRLYLISKTDTVTAVTKSIPATLKYTRSFSPTDVGLSALMKTYAESHPGVYGVSLVELSGARRNASYQSDRSFTTASTFKLFVAYSTLKRVEEGVWKWSDQIQGGRDLAKCFDDMIVKSDNPCADTLLQKIGFKPITDEAKALGLTGTSFLGKDGIKTTPRDLSLFLSQLQSGQMLSQQLSRDRLLEAMKRNQYRQGIPAGTGNAVANKVGFLDGLFHDAAIVYGPSGPYVLVIMTEGSNWATIADLTRQIEALRAS